MATTFNLSRSSDDEKYNPGQPYSISRDHQAVPGLSVVAGDYIDLDQRVGWTNPAHHQFRHYVPHPNGVQSAHASLGSKDMNYRKPSDSAQSASSRKFDELTGGRLPSPPPKPWTPMITTTADNFHSKRQSLDSNFPRPPRYFTSGVVPFQNEVVRHGADPRTTATPRSSYKESMMPELTRPPNSDSRVGGGMTGMHSPPDWLSKVPKAARKGFTPTRNSVHSEHPKTPTLPRNEMSQSSMGVNGSNGGIGSPTEAHDEAATKVAWEGTSNHVRSIRAISSATPVRLHRQVATKAARKQAMNGMDTLPTTRTPPISNRPTVSPAPVNNISEVHPRSVREEMEVMETPSMIIHSKVHKAATGSPSNDKPHVTSEVAADPKIEPMQKLPSAQKDVASKIPLALQDFEKVLQNYLANLHAAHEYHVKSRLSQARKLNDRDSKDSTASPSRRRRRKRSRDFVQKVSPFASLKDLSCGASTAIRPSQKVGKLAQYVSKVPRPINLYPVEVYRETGTPIPPYTNYISTKRNILVEDDKHRTFLPYHGDEFIVDREYARLEAKIERNQRNYHELNGLAEKAAFYSRHATDFLAEVGCNVSAVLQYLLNTKSIAPPPELPFELSDVWHRRESYLDDGFYEEGDDSDNISAHRRTSRPQKQWRVLYESIPKAATGRMLAAACLACATFAKLAGFSLWHVVKQTRFDSPLTIGRGAKAESLPSRGYNSLSPDSNSHSLGTYAELVCQVCKAHECPGHGEFEDEGDEKNIRVRVNCKPSSPKSPKRNSSNGRPNKARMGLEDPTAQQALGMNDDKTISGAFWSEVGEEGAGLKDDEVCSDECFWPKENRYRSLSEWSKADREVLETLRPAYENDRRGSCMMSQSGLIGKPCVEIFLMLFETAPCETRYSTKAHNEALAVGSKPPPRKSFEYYLDRPDMANTFMLHERLAFTPCNHAGPCDETTNCDCYNQKITCEKSCACSSNCGRRFRGCRCAARGKVCRNNEKCDCWRLNRECDPDLCRTCGAHEVLDPANRHNDAVAHGKCTNVYIQRGVPKRTLLGKSKMMSEGKRFGWGLYMGEICKKGDYIGEYTGEIVSELEADQRGTIYDKRNLSYLFSLNKDQTLDSTLMGNKLRFINHQSDPFVNCQAKTLICNTVQRIGMFAIKDIEIGEEMFFNYGPGFASKFDLIRMNHDGPPTIEKPISSYRLGSIKAHSRQMKNTVSKNGNRIGRPPKLGEADALHHHSLSSEPTKRAHKRRRSEANFDGAADEDEDDESRIKDESDEEGGGYLDRRVGSSSSRVILHDVTTAADKEVEGEGGASEDEDDDSDTVSVVESEEEIRYRPRRKKRGGGRRPKKEYETPQKRGWRTRHANMARRIAELNGRAYSK